MFSVSGRNRGKVDKEEWRSGSEPPSPTNEPPPSPHQKQNQRTCQELGLDLPNDQDNALKAKKKILLSSLCSGSRWSEEGNSRRLGPNKYNVFECLQKSPITSPRAADECKKFTCDEFKNKNDMVRLGNVYQRDSIEKSSRSPEHNHSPQDSSEIDPRYQSGASKCSQSEGNTSVNQKGKYSPKQNPAGKDCTVEDLGSLKLTEDTLLVVKKPDSASKLEPEQTSIKETKSVDNEMKSTLAEVCATKENCNNLTSKENSGGIPVNDEVKLEGSSSEDVKQKVDEIELMDLDDVDPVPEFLDRCSVATPISIATAIELKKVVLGSATAKFSPQWLDQGFVFNTNHKLRYGFVQKKVSM